MVEYRKYKPEDREILRDICKSQATYHGKNKGKLECVCYMFIDYYLDYEPDNVIVAVDDGVVCGYIVGSTNLEQYIEKNRKEYARKIAKVSWVWSVFFRACINTNKHWDSLGGYAFHINIADGHQGKKIGTNLMHTAMKNAHDKGKKFLYLVTKNNKTDGYKFYSKLGFKVTKKLFGGSLLMTYDVQNWV
ncbi:MAG: GNAT family N-acetyltransferase [Clostridia bacterium]|nr:GNAT family N-acetyltransferase [Clostridia bacterium]